MFRLGLGGLMGNPASGYIMVIITIGAKTGKVRYTPVNYAISDGQVYCLAGFGQVSHWYRNVHANPQVALLMPGGAITARAEQVADPAERLKLARQVLINGGFAGFFFGFNPRRVDDERLAEALGDIPVLRFHPTGIGSGPADPGGWLWILGALLTLGWLLRGRSGRRR
jgi:deazaflavin-dependent oxidoreductase (nitroreductase family)